jgi:hypothetical protein
MANCGNHTDPLPSCFSPVTTYACESEPAVPVSVGHAVREKICPFVLPPLRSGLPGQVRPQTGLRFSADHRVPRSSPDCAIVQVIIQVIVQAMVQADRPSSSSGDRGLSRKASSTSASRAGLVPVPERVCRGAQIGSAVTEDRSRPGWRQTSAHPALLQLLTCPFPITSYLVEVSSASANGPRQCSFWVLMPISAPKPNSPPSEKRVEAFQYTAAEST